MSGPYGVPHKDEYYCLYNSVIGDPGDPSLEKITDYVENTRTLYLIELVAYYSLAIGIAVFMIFKRVRRDKTSRF